MESNFTSGCLEGQRYPTHSTDTLDLADRMGSAINALTNVWDPDQKWALGFLVDFSQRPAVLYPSHLTDAYLNIPPKFIEALVLCRLGSGSRLNTAVDDAVIQAQLSLLGQDGLSFCPEGTLPQFTQPRGFAEIWAEGRMLSALSTLTQVNPDPRWVQAGKKKIDRLLELSVLGGGFRFFPKGRFRPGQRWMADAGEPSVPDPNGSLADYDPVFSRIYSIGALGLGAGLFYRVTGYEPALELSGGLARWGLKRVFNNPEGRYDFWHFHHGLYALMAVWEYAFAANDRTMMQRVDACYRWAREMGDPLIGFFPELFPEQSFWTYMNWNGKTIEICEVADMIWLALNLTRAGIGDYWDDVDRWTRNIFAEGQLVDPIQYERIPESWFVQGAEPRPHQDTRDIHQRSIGAFLGWMRANDGLKTVKSSQGTKIGNLGIQHCCTANGARTLYHIWDSIITREGGALKVNLLLNRASPELDIDSCLPAEGRVTLKIKDCPAVMVRMPEWCDLSAVRLTQAGQPLAHAFQGRCVCLEGLQPGTIVEITFPMPEQTVTRVLGDLPFRLRLRGANVVGIDPAGTAVPLFSRQPTGKLAEKERFIPARSGIIW
jgi:hypothetical protein